MGVWGAGMFGGAEFVGLLNRAFGSGDLGLSLLGPEWYPVNPATPFHKHAVFVGVPGMMRPRA